MSDPVVLRVVRPYSSEAELLGAEGWTITMKRVVLIDARPVKRGTTVQVELLLETGEKLLRAEGKAVGMAKARGDRPQGLEVRLKRYGAATKRFLERAAQAATEVEAPPAEADEEEAVEAELVSQVETELVSQVDALDDEPITDVDVLGGQAGPITPDPSPDSDLSGVRVRSVDPPPDRDALLERLRERARKIASSKEN